MNLLLKVEDDLHTVRDIFEQHCRELQPPEEDVVTSAVITIDIPTSRDVKFELFNYAMESVTEYHPSPRYRFNHLYVTIIYTLRI